ncbi:MAG: DUF2058 domain-containing protein [bacterium]
MAGSLQDQLLGAGLIDKKKAKKITAQQRQAKKKSRKTQTPIKDEAAELAQQVQQAQREKSQALNEQRKQAAEQKAIAAQIRQIIMMNQIDLEDQANDTRSYNFSDQKKIKSLILSARNHELVTAGRIAIATSSGRYYLIPAEAAKKIQLRDDRSILVLNERSQQVDDQEEDDPYADFQVPDDLMW